MSPVIGLLKYFPLFRLTYYDVNGGFMAVIANGAQDYTFYLTNFTNNTFMEMIQQFV